jgi:ribosomal protein L11 methylase PrmA
MGCGTAILAILAEMKGAQPIDAIDIDNWCYQNSIENAERNHCKSISVFEGDAALLKGKKYDLIISNYAFTECTKSIQDIYLEKVINHSKKGYITCNHISDLFQISSYSKQELLTLLKDSKEKPEEPITFNNNYILYW